MINKTEVCSIIHFHVFLVPQFSANLKIFQSDWGGEYLSTKLQNYPFEHGIIHQRSCHYTPKQNGLAEMKHRHIVETVVTLL